MTKTSQSAINLSQIPQSASPIASQPNSAQMAQPPIPLNTETLKTFEQLGSFAMACVTLCVALWLINQILNSFHQLIRTVKRK